MILSAASLHVNNRYYRDDNNNNNKMHMRTLYPEIQILNSTSTPQSNELATALHHN